MENRNSKDSQKEVQATTNELKKNSPLTYEEIEKDLNSKNHIGYK